jgi:hypothetical protein
MTLTAQQLSLEELLEARALMPLADALSVISATEPISSVMFTTGETKVHFSVEPGWNLLTEPDAVAGEVTIGNKHIQLTYDAMLEATSICGIPKGYALRCPDILNDAALNYWFSGGFSKEFKLLMTGDIGAAFTRATIQPFSNVLILDKVVERIEEFYEFGSWDIYVDAKMHHTLKRTDIRLVVPGYNQIIDSARSTVEHPDIWSTGISVSNSLIGESQTAVEGYMFAWLCSNGMIDRRHGQGVWSRRSGGQNEEEMLAWVGKCVDEALIGMPHLMATVGDLINVKLEGSDEEVSDTVSDIFRHYQIPPLARDEIVQRMVDTDDLTMYAVMQAITQAANNPILRPEHVEQLLVVGGEIPAVASERCASCHRIRA